VDAQTQNVLKIGWMGTPGLKKDMDIQKWQNLPDKRTNELRGMAVGDKKYEIEFSSWDVKFDPAKTLTAMQKGIYQDKVVMLVHNYLTWAGKITGYPHRLIANT
jgi:hypothetical protein